MNIIQNLRQIYRDIVELILLQIAGYRLTVAIRMADYKQRAFNRQFIVFPVGFAQLKVYSRSDVERLKRTPFYTRKSLNKWRKVEHKRIDELKAINYAKFLRNEITLDTYTKLNREVKQKHEAIDRDFETKLRTKVIDRDTTWDYLKRESYYRTPVSRNNSPELTPAERIELRAQWLKDFSILRKKGMA